MKKITESIIYGQKCSVGLNEGKNTLEPLDEPNPTLTFVCKQHLWLCVRKHENRKEKLYLTPNMKRVHVKK